MAKKPVELIYSDVTIEEVPVDQARLWAGEIGTWPDGSRYVIGSDDDAGE